MGEEENVRDRHAGPNDNGENQNAPKNGDITPAMTIEIQLCCIMVI